ncbi:hypothetical protein [Tenacibaculum sp. 190524A02b]|uniref:hypothetical protein n=1 Tax=Tenacibaculum vairaonense TaxID=3137860 RepID=UPI0031FB7767
MCLKVGIDPDVDKNGVAILNENEGDLKLLNLKFFELYDLLKKLKKDNEKLLVLIEGGWMNMSNWHKDEYGTAAKNAEIGKRTGANHEVGKKIVEMAQYLEITHLVVKPTKTKVKSKLFHKITGVKRSNQEQRDAYMLLHRINKKIKNVQRDI